MTDGVRCAWMRGGTSKGGVFLADDLPSAPAARDALLLAIMGSPDPRQIDGMGGAHPLTSKVAVVARSTRPGVDVDYLFLQVSVDEALVSDGQNCGNMLAAVGPFAIERGLVAARDGETAVTIHMENTGQRATATVRTPGGRVRYDGDAAIDGVPGTAAAIPLTFRDTAGASCGALLPTGRVVDMIVGVGCTLIDNGMPCVVLAAADLGLTGYEPPAMLDADAAVRSRVEAIRLAAGPLMRLGDVERQSVPKMVLVAPPRAGGAIATRSFIPHRAHDAIGVFAAVTVATACLLPGSPAAAMARVPAGDRPTIAVEHPTGATTCVLDLAADRSVRGAGIVRTARLLMDGMVFPRHSPPR